MTPQPPDLRWTPFYFLLRKEIARFLRVFIQTFLIPLINTFLYLTIFGVSLGKQIRIEGPWSYLAFLIPGLLMMSVLDNAFQNSSSSIATSKFHGNLEDLKVGPLKVWQLLWSFGVAGLVRGVMVGSIMLVFGEVFYYFQTGTWLPILHPLLLIYFLVVGGLSFAFLGVAVTFLANSLDQLSAIGGFVLLPLIYLGGVFYSLDHLHPFWRALSQFNPLLYFINGVRYGILGIADVPVWYAAAISTLALAIIYGVADHAIRRGSYGRW